MRNYLCWEECDRNEEKSDINCFLLKKKLKIKVQGAKFNE